MPNHTEAESDGDPAIARLTARLGQLDRAD